MRDIVYERGCTHSEYLCSTYVRKTIAPLSFSVYNKRKTQKRERVKDMTNERQRAILEAYGKAQLTLKSHAVVSYDYGNADSGYLVLPCDELWTSRRRRNEDHEVINWMHPHIQPYWDEYDISEDDFSEYMHKHFSILYK